VTTEQPAEERKVTYPPEDRLRLLLTAVEQSAKGVVVVGLDQTVLFVNEAFARMHGRTREDVTGEKVTLFHSPDQLPSVQRARRLVRAEGVFRGELQHTRADGTVFTAQMENSLVRDEDGRPIGVIATLRDVTEELRAEELLRTQRDLALELAAAHDEHRALLACLNAAIAATGMDSGAVYQVEPSNGNLRLVAERGLSPAFREQVKLHPGDSPEATLVAAGRPVYGRYADMGLRLGPIHRAEGLQALGVVPVIHEGRSVAALVVSSHTSDSLPSFARTALEGVAALSGAALERVRLQEELQRSRAELKRRVAEKTEALQRANDRLRAGLDELTRTSAALQDANGELQRSNRELEQFAYVISHDLQEPLRMVTGFMDLLQRRYGDSLDDTAQEFVGYAHDGAQRMTELIRELLEYSRAGRRRRPLAPVDLSEVLNLATHFLQPAIEEAAAEIEAKPLPRVQGDSRQLVRLLQNLLSNALRFRRADVPPKIELRAEQQGRFWELSVADNGVGVPPEHSERVFGVFQRLHTREEYPGTGMGLAICRRIVERHGGRIWVDEAAGPGATFHVTLPALPEDVPPGHEEPASRRSTTRQIFD